MMSPSPLSLFCALLLCLPFAVFFTLTTPTIPSSAAVSSSTSPTRRSLENPLDILSQKSHDSHTTITLRTINSLLPPPSPPPQEHTAAVDNDDQLLQLASKVNVRPRNPKKIAFMFLTTSPLHFAPVWELYFNKTSSRLFNIYIHADPNHTYAPPFSGVFAHRVIPSKPAQRFTPTLAAAARRLLAHALLDDRANAMFALLSPSCIPLHSFNYTYRALTRSRRSFIEILKDEEWAYDRWAARGEDSMLPEVKLEDFRIGSQFWVLTRKHARLVVSDRRIWAKFNQTCVKEDACYPEENYFSTLVHMLDPRGTVSATLTHVDWRDSFDGHPRMYNVTEVGPELIMTLRNETPRYGYDGINGSDLPVTRRRDEFLFARKFSPESIEPLMRIAKEAILKD
ncbi:Core-2/I-branching beta-1 6-N-acetylglucosaminyltransferase family protein [Euphorbia peplus]|nr:Core-2/I-branching beta-1 6-N-acetylglucosaminyltransferase family protein [Euphorbia peplus]